MQIDVDPGMLSIRHPMEVNLIGDSRDTLAALLRVGNAEAQQLPCHPVTGRRAGGAALLGGRLERISLAPVRGGCPFPPRPA